MKMFREKLKEENALASFLCSFIIFALGVFILCCPVLHILDFTFVYPLFFGVYALTDLVLFALSYHRKEYSYFVSFLVSFVLFVLLFVFDLTSSPRSIALSLLIFVLFNSLAKLKRADYYHDKKSKMWTVEVVLLGLFFLTSIFTSMNFAFGVETQILVLGFFTIICGIFKVVEWLIVYLTKGKLK